MSFKLNDFIKNRVEKKIFTGLPLTIFIIVFLLLLATFLGITDSVVNSRPIVTFDNSFAHSLYLIRTSWMVEIFYVITNLGDVVTMFILIVISMIYLFLKKELAYLYSLVITTLGTELSVYWIKILINRARPGADIAYYLENSKSFPSAHSAIAMAFIGFVIYYLVEHVSKKQQKSIIIFLGTLLIVLIGFSRLYLGVHYLSDVLGGFLMGGLFLVIGITFRERHFYTSSIKKGVDNRL